MLACGFRGDLGRGIDGAGHETPCLGIESNAEGPVACLDRKPGDERQRADNAETGGVAAFHRHARGSRPPVFLPPNRAVPVPSISLIIENLAQEFVC